MIVMIMIMTITQVIGIKMNQNEEIKNGLLALHEIDMAIEAVQHSISKLQVASKAIQRSLLNARSNEDEELK